MADHLLLPLLVAAVVGEEWWTRRRIRQHFADQGATVVAIHWQPLAPLLSLRFKQLTSLYRVRYRDRSGRALTCRFVAGMWDGFGAEDITADAADHAEPAARTDPATAAPAVGIRHFLAIALACAVGCCLAQGATWWSLPYGGLNLPDGLYPGLLALPLCAGVLAWWQPARAIIGGVLLGLTVPVVIAVRIATDLARDPTTHNLLGIEVIFAVVIGAVAAGAGVLTARVLRR